MSDHIHDNGMRVRREVLGDDHVDAAVERTAPFTADFQDFITRYPWGEVWTLPGLDRRTRSCITLTVLMARAGRRAQRSHRRRDQRGAPTGGGLLRGVRRQRCLLHRPARAHRARQKPRSGRGPTRVMALERMLMFLRSSITCIEDRGKETRSGSANEQ